jgi:hypothetical protein
VHRKSATETPRRELRAAYFLTVAKPSAGDLSCGSGISEIDSITPLPL